MFRPPPAWPGPASFAALEGARTGGGAMLIHTAMELGEYFGVTGAKMVRPLPELTAKELDSYSVARAVQVAAGLLRGNCIEREYSDAVMRERPYRGEGDFALPMAVLTRALYGASPSAGGDLVFTRPGEFFPPLRPRSIALALGATFLEDFPLPAALPGQTATPPATWVVENPSVDVPDEDVALGQVPLSAHILTASTAFSAQLLAQSKSSTSVDEVVRQDFAGRAGQALDAAGIDGSGEDNQPRGILHTDSIGNVPLGDNGAVPTYGDIVDLEFAVADANADMGNLGFATTPAMRKLLRKTPRLAGVAGSGVVWDRGNRVLDYPAAVSKNVPGTLTKGATSGACHAIVFGNWSDLIIATAGAFFILVDPIRLKKRALIEVTMFLAADVALRRAASFAAITDATTS